MKREKTSTTTTTTSNKWKRIKMKIPFFFVRFEKLSVTEKHQQNQ